MDIFHDRIGNKVTFGWWLRWKIAKWHWRCWLRYEGMPKQFTTIDQMHTWNRLLIKMQDKED